MSIDYSIIIPAFNEEEMLANTIKYLNDAMATISLTGEIVVTDNNSTDSTAEIAKNAGAIVVFESINQISRSRNAGAKAANGRYFIFVDADTIVPSGLLQTALSNLESGECCGGGATVTSNDVPLFVKGVLGYWNSISRVFSLAAGCFVYARRDDFESCGGFSKKVYATEEIWFSMALKRKAKKYKRKFRIINKPKAITSGRKLVWFSHSYQILLLTIIFLFPFVTRFKCVCAYWYKRPQKK
ncbi:MAG: glycosyltransferase [Gammaproteobacteria bacterium]|nr:glycosyltransferase [Gammaproteobacteria bacterium]